MTNTNGTMPQTKTYADVLKSAKKLGINGLPSSQIFDKLSAHVQSVIIADAEKSITAKLTENIGKGLTECQALMDNYADTLAVEMRVIMDKYGLTSVNLTVTPDSFAIVKRLDKPASTSRTRTSSKPSNLTYYVNGEMVIGGSSAVAEKIGIDTTTKAYIDANAWLKIASRAHEINAVITSVNAETDAVLEFAPIATKTEKHAVWLAVK